MSPIVVTAMGYRPIKGGRWIPLTEAVVTERGIEHDCCWMVVEKKSGMFVAQRQAAGLGIPIRSMSQVLAEIVGNHLRIRVPYGKDRRTIYLPAAGMKNGQEREVQIWKDKCPGLDQGDEIADLLTEFLGQERPGTYRLVRIPDDYKRPSKQGGGFQAYHDGYPITIDTVASGVLLNTLLANKGEACIPPTQFRTSITVEYPFGRAHEEDEFEIVELGGLRLVGQTLCQRCSVPAIDQETSVQNTEPNITLGSYRRGKYLDMTGEDANKIFWSRNFTIADGFPHHVFLLDIGEVVVRKVLV